MVNKAYHNSGICTVQSSSKIQLIADFCKCGLNVKTAYHILLVMQGKQKIIIVFSSVSDLFAIHIVSQFKRGQYSNAFKYNTIRQKYV